MRKAELEREIIALLVKGLTPNQRNALLWLPEDGSERQDDATLRLERSLWVLTGRQVVPGVKADLVVQRHPQRMVDGRWPRSHWKATPLGLKVRAVVAGSASASIG